MNFRERLLAAISHQEPDRVPINLGSTPSSGRSAIAYGNRKTHLDIAGGSAHVYDVMQQIALSEDVLLNPLMECHMSMLEKTCRAVCNVIWFRDDLETNGRPFMSPDIRRTLFKSWDAMLCDHVHKHSGMKTFLHSCGSICALLPNVPAQNIKAIGEFLS